MKMQTFNIILTGGHAATTAIPVINELKAKYTDANLYWVGASSAVEGKFVPTLASQVMPKIGVKFVSITTGRLQRRFTFWTIPSLLKIPVGIFQSFKIIYSLKPKFVLSFGGYASVPVCFVAYLFGVPVFIHEQTVAVGLANKVSARFAKKIFIARGESGQYFDNKKTILTGNPVSAEIAKLKIKTKPHKPFTIYITGGSSGAQRINKTIKESLYDLIKNYKLIHQTGKIDFEEFKKMKEEFPSDLAKNYEVYDFIDPAEISNVFERVDMVITRAGANTLSEIMVAKIPAIIVPISWTSHNEQVKNARMVEKTGLGIVVEEKDLNSSSLLSNIESISNNWQKMIKTSDNSISELDKAAAKRIVNELGTYV